MADTLKDTLDVDDAERAKYLQFIAHRAGKIVELASADSPVSGVRSAQDYLLSRQIFMLVKPAAMLFGPQLRGAFLHWFADQIRGEHGICFLCGKVKDKPADQACGDCLKDMAQDAIDMGLSNLVDDVFGRRQ